MEIAYDERGLVPVIVQDWNSGEVLTLAYANEEAVRRTRESGELHLYSRSRAEQWHKGATSGNTQAVRALRLDCDGDALLALVEPAGPACHTGERTCFHEGQLEPPAPHEALPILERTIAQRDADRSAGSYTVTLLEDPVLAGEKVREEAEEVDACSARGDRRARRQRGGGRPLPPRRAAARPRPLARPTPESCSMAVAADEPAPPCRCSRASTRSGRWPPTTTSSRCATASSTTPRRRCPRSSSCAAASREFPAFLLESAERGQQFGRYSFIGVRPRKIVRWSLGDEPADPYQLAADEVGAFRAAPWPEMPPFAGGAVGFFGYDLVRTVEPLGEPNPDPVGLPDMALMLSDVLLVFDHLKHTISVLVNVYVGESATAASRPPTRTPSRRSARRATCSPGPCRGPSRRPRARARRSPRT